MRPEQYRIIRERLGLSQPAMANRLNELDPHLRVDATSISRYERGKHKPSPHIEAAYETVALQAGAAEQPIPSYEAIQAGDYRRLIEDCDKAIAGEQSGFSPGAARAIRRLAANTLRSNYGIEVE